MAKLSSFPSGAVASGDHFLGVTPKGKTKKITMGRLLTQVPR